MALEVQISLILSTIAVIGAVLAPFVLTGRIRALRVEIDRNGAGQPEKGLLKDEIRKLTRRVEENEVSWDNIYGKMSRGIRAIEKRDQRDRAKPEEDPDPEPGSGGRRSELWRRARQKQAPPQRPANK